MTALLMVGCRKPDPLVGEYTSVGSGRPDGGWTVRFYASGECKVHGPLDGAGTYKTNTMGYQLETRVQSVWQMLGYDTGASKLTLISFKTNGTEYLIDAARYKSFVRSGDTNLLRYELRKVR